MLGIEPAETALELACLDLMTRGERGGNKVGLFDGCAVFRHGNRRVEIEIRINGRINGKLRRIQVEAVLPVDSVRCVAPYGAILELVIS